MERPKKRNPLLNTPHHWLLQGLRTISSVPQSLYAEVRSTAKATAKLTFIGEQKLSEVQTQLYSYSATDCQKQSPYPGHEFWQDDSQKHWLNFHGLHEVETISQFAETVGLERQTIRYILDTTLRPKVEDYERYLFFTVKALTNKKDGSIGQEQHSFVLGSNFVLSFQEELGDHFEGIREKMTSGAGFIRQRGTDYLLIQLLDALLDNYFEVIERLNAEVTEIDRVVFGRPDNQTLVALEMEKRSALVVRKVLLPFKEALTRVLDDPSPLIRAESIKHYREVLHSATGALEEVEAIIRTLESLTNIYYATLSQRMNETMKVLTTVATIFIPLTFIAGIYGMNFDVMPELRNPYGYYIVWGVMVALGGGMVYLFKRKRWL